MSGGKEENSKKIYLKPQHFMLKYHINKWVQVNLNLISLKSKRGKPMET